MHADVLGDSWLEFVLDPTKLDLHLEAINSGKVSNPSGLVLIKTFVKQAEKPSTSAQSKREKLLNGLAAKVWHSLGISLDEIEKNIPPKYQRQLLAEMVSTFNTPVVNSILHRWVLRTIIHGVDPDLVRYDPESSMQFLKNWISSINPNEPHHDVQVKKQFLSASFDMGEYLLYGGDFASAENYLRTARELHMNESFKDSISVINEDRLNGLLLATNLNSSKDITKEKKMAQTEQACTNPERWTNLTSVLETDTSELPWAYRWNLEAHAHQPIPPALAAQISGVNVTRHGIQADLSLVPNWQQKLRLGDKSTIDFFFQSCSKAAKNHSTTNNTSTNNNSTNHHIKLADGLTSGDVVRRRMGALARRVCKMLGTTQAWSSFVENVSPDIEITATDSASKQALEQRDACNARVRESAAQLADIKQENSNYLLRVVQSARDQQFLLNVDTSTISPELIIAKARECFLKSDFAQAKRLYQSNQQTNPTTTLKCAYGMLLVDMAQYLQQQLPYVRNYNPLITHYQPPPTQNQEAYAALLEQLHKCLAQGLPDVFSLQHILIFLIDTSHWADLQKVCSEMKQKLDKKIAEEANLHNGENIIMCELALGIAEIMLVIASFTDSQGQAQMTRSLDPLLTRYFPILLSYPGVLYTLLGELRSPTFLATLACLCVGVLHTLLKTKQATTPTNPLSPLSPLTATSPTSPLTSPNTDVSLERYGIIAEVAALCKCKSISITMDGQLIDTMQQALIRLQTTSPSHVWLAGLADTLFEQSRLREAVEFYLLAICTESTWFVGLKLGAHVYGMLGRLVSALISLKCTSPAIVLLQLVPNGYTIAARIIQEDPYALDPSYFQYIYEVSYLELLVYIYSRAKDDKKTNYLTQMLGVPELNEYNPSEMRQAFIHHIRLNLFRTLFVDFLT